MEEVRVKWFNDQKGFGFLTNSKGKDIFVHHSVIEGREPKTLVEGETVLAEYEEGPKGFLGKRVVVPPKRPDPTDG